MKALLHKFLSLFRRRPQATAAALEHQFTHAATLAEQLRLFNARRLKRMSEETSLDYASIHRLARAYKISTAELVDYYSYFGNIPDAAHKNIIQHFGVKNIIAEAETRIEELTKIY